MSGNTLDTQLVDDLVRFLRDRYEDEIATFAQRYPRDESVFYIDYADLRAWSPDFADDYLSDAERIRSHIEEALAKFELPADIDLSGATVRIIGLGEAADELVWRVGSYLPSDISDSFELLRGQVTKRTQPSLRPTTAVWECARCGAMHRIPQPRDEQIQEPHECIECERQGPFRSVESEMVQDAINHQMIRLQTPPEHSAGQSDETIDVVLERDLVKSCEPGDRVVVGADIVPQLDEDSDEPELTMRAQADTIEKEETDFSDLSYDEHEERINEIANSADPYQKIVDSILPSHEGDDEIKLAIALQLFGGVPKELPDGHQVRGDIHIFLVGDPGVGKSTLMRYVNELAPRSVYTSGNGTTSAGLTGAAVQDDFGDGGWTIEAGALVEAHGGVCCIDELDDMDEEDRAGLLQAMSDQEINMSKAGINATLPAKTTVLAAANPKMGRFDMYEPVAEQVDIDPALFSRFDLMFPMTDRPDSEQDEETANHIMETQQTGQRRANKTASSQESEVTPEIEPEVLRAYIARGREEMPVLTDTAKERISSEYVKIRDAAGEDDPVPTNPRMLECLTRLSEASARIRLSDTVTIEDAERAIELYEEFMSSFGIDPDAGEFDVDAIETGQTKSQRERVSALLSVVRALESEYDSGAPVSAVEDHPSLDEYDSDKIQHEIQNQKDQGELYEPQQNHLRTP